MNPKPAEEGTWGHQAWARRQELGWSQVHAVAIICALAEANGETGITQQGLSRFETGQTHPHFSTLEKIARAYGQKVEELFPMSMRPHGPSLAALEARGTKGSRRKRGSK